MIFDVDSKCVHPRSWFRALMVRHRHNFVRILRFFNEHRLLEIQFYDVSWCQMSSLVTPHTLGSLHTCPGPFSRSLIFDDFWRIKWYPNEEFSTWTLMISNVDSKCIHPGFWIRALEVRRRHHSVRILEILRKVPSWHPVLWSLVVSIVIPGDSPRSLESLHDTPYSPSFLWSNRIQMKNSQFRLKWFST